jgi:hypothetical protein
MKSKLLWLFLAAFIVGGLLSSLARLLAIDPHLPSGLDPPTRAY